MRTSDSVHGLSPNTSLKGSALTGRIALLIPLRIPRATVKRRELNYVNTSQEKSEKKAA
ncbi:hypothetical protein CC1G_15808 [Coprinopsis cinerea okayama7|uniref:Uncharacterized protein n=1 Tax=Coprinopsis cinerea (strain Okayama-7 / 130 / ATCC MYA-4618 / FGSC 9003) TaxID=240176 RepID=A8PHY9_COPC7|nr:hypothetical protein CC1G_15808 [Coprinopsis cinerea okayama7\|eukprot:XP_001841491.2 hypothetical protein CC1G_15808 [Coprinopsis cinerea okayama7\